MSFQRWGFTFDGPFADPYQLKASPGVYFIRCLIGNSEIALDVGESDDVQDRVVNHDRKDCWKTNCLGTIYYAATFISSQDKRKEIERFIRSRTNPRCGEI